jgi:hypothetical protein
MFAEAGSLAVTSEMGARNRYPWRGTVSTKTGVSAESCSAYRSLLMAVFRGRRWWDILDADGNALAINGFL